MNKYIEVKGTKVNNLKDINVFGQVIACFRYSLR